VHPSRQYTERPRIGTSSAAGSPNQSGPPNVRRGESLGSERFALVVAERSLEDGFGVVDFPKLAEITDGLTFLDANRGARGVAHGGRMFDVMEIVDQVTAGKA